MKELLDGFFKDVIEFHIISSKYTYYKDGYYIFKFYYGFNKYDFDCILVKDGLLYSRITSKYLESNSKWILYSRKKKLEILNRLL